MERAINPHVPNHQCYCYDVFNQQLSAHRYSHLNKVTWGYFCNYFYICVISDSKAVYFFYISNRFQSIYIQIFYFQYHFMLMKVHALYDVYTQSYGSMQHIYIYTCLRTDKPHWHVVAQKSVSHDINNWQLASEFWHRS